MSVYLGNKYKSPQTEFELEEVRTLSRKYREYLGTR